MNNVTCNEVPHHQAVDTHDGADRIVSNVEDGEDNVDEGEDETNEEKDDDGDEHAHPDHVWLGIKLFITIIFTDHQLILSGVDLAGRTEEVVSHAEELTNQN